MAHLNYEVAFSLECDVHDSDNVVVHLKMFGIRAFLCVKLFDGEGFLGYVDICSHYSAGKEYRLFKLF